jgi:hypothetical protein
MRINPVKVLFVAGESYGDWLPLPCEHTDIDAVLAAGATARGITLLQPIFRATRGVLIGRLVRDKPDVVHFVGHGEDRRLKLYDGEEGKDDLPAEDLAAIFANLARRVALVVLNTCESLSMARLLVERQSVIFAVGHAGSIDDPVARKFGSTFYSIIAAGESLQSAFELARLDAGADAMKDTELIPSPGSDPSKTFFGTGSPNAAGEHQAPSDERSEVSNFALRKLDQYCPPILRWISEAGLLSGPPPETQQFHEYLADLRDNPERKPRDRSGHDAVIERPEPEVRYSKLSARDVPAYWTTYRFAERQAQGGAYDLLIRSIRKLARAEAPVVDATAPVTLFAHRARTIRNIVRILCATRKPLLLLGDPGSGKTMTMRQIVLDLAESGLRRRFPLIPIYTRLADFQGHAGTKSLTADDVMEFVQSQLKHARDGPVRQHLNELVKRNRVVFIFDGMDEMPIESRHERLKALRVFADSYGINKNRTLFTSRVSNFDPWFKHRRLVISPLGKSEIEDFLRKQANLQEDTIVDMGEEQLVGVKSILENLTTKLHGFDPRNPFELGLFCEWLESNKSWPTSRPEMLESYFENIYTRAKSRLIGNAESLPQDRGLVFDAWAEIACLATQHDATAGLPLVMVPEQIWGRNRQSSLSRYESVRAGEFCGVLERPTEDSVRFIRQRDREFFAARYYADGEPGRAFTAAFDSPLWEEVAINVILKGDSASKLLMGAWTEALAIHVRSYNESIEKHSGPERAPSMPRAEQDEWVRKVELTARLLRQTRPSSRVVPESLVRVFGTSVDAILQAGRSRSKERVIEACRGLAEWDVLGLLEPAIRSPVRFIQMLGLSVLHERASGPNSRIELPKQIGIDLAKGEMLRVINAYMKTILQLRDGKNRFYVAAGVIAALVQTSALLLLSLGLLWGVRESARPLSWVTGQVLLVGQQLDLEVRNDIREVPGAWLLGLRPHGHNDDGPLPASGLIGIIEDSATQLVKALDRPDVRTYSGIALALAVLSTFWLRFGDALNYIAIGTLLVPASYQLAILGWSGNLVAMAVLALAFSFVWKLIVRPLIGWLSAAIRAIGLALYLAVTLGAHKTEFPLTAFFRIAWFE